MFTRNDVRMLIECLYDYDSDGHIGVNLPEEFLYETHRHLGSIPVEVRSTHPSYSIRPELLIDSAFTWRTTRLASRFPGVWTRVNNRWLNWIGMRADSLEDAPEYRESPTTSSGLSFEQVWRAYIDTRTGDPQDYVITRPD